MALILNKKVAQARQDYLATMMRLSLSTTNDNFHRSVETALRRTGEYFGADRVYALQAHRDGSFHLVTEWTRIDIPSLDASVAVIPAGKLRQWSDTLEDGFSVSMPQGKRFPQIPTGVAFLIPMNGEDGLTGLIGIENVSPVLLDDEKEQQFLGIVAYLIQTTMRRLDGDTDQNKDVPTDTQLDGVDETRHLGRIVEMMTNLVEIVDTEQRIVWTNKAFEDETGHALNNIRGLDLSDLLLGEASNREVADEVRLAISEGRGLEAENINYRKDGTPYWVTFNMQPLNDTTGRLTGFVFVETVITERRELESILRAERDFLGALTETSVSAVVACDVAGNCVFANSEAERLLRRPAHKTFPRATVWPLSSLSESVASAFETPFRHVMKTGVKIRAMNVALTHPDETRRILSVNAAPLTDVSTRARVIITLTDITAQYEAEDAIREATLQALRNAEYEQVTGLPNRYQLTRHLAAAIKEYPQPQAKLYVAIIDLDGFKTIKTVLGHDIGDDLLSSVANRLSEAAGTAVMIACIGGDSFVASVRADIKEIDDLMMTLLKAIAKPYDLHQTNIFITASIGVACQQSPDDTAETLIQKAEVASYASNTQGGNKHSYHDTDIEVQFTRRSDILQALRDALQSDQFELAFQPKYALTSGFPHIGAEALLRWTSPTLGRVGPAEFIPVAEAAGVISEIDFHVMDIFARQLGIWQQAGLVIPSSMNLSPRSFENVDLAPHLLARLAAENVPCGNVTIEITETSLVSSSRTALENIECFKRAGITLAVDDFGTGYSSLSYLQRLIVSEVKIDKSFVQKIGRSQGTENSEAIVRTILMLAKNFGLRSVAEGVETLDQLTWLRQEGCDAIQGYLGGKAMSAEKYEAIFLTRGTLFGSPQEN